MHTRENALNKWLEQLFYNSPFTLTPLAGDASFRRYYRLHLSDVTRIVMDAPPNKETLKPFININQSLAKNKIHTPNIFAFDLDQGFMLLEDLGDQLLLQKLSQENANALYSTAIDILLQIQQITATHFKLPAFDKHFMLGELSLFRVWFLEAFLKQPLSTSENTTLNKTFDWLTKQLTTQPQVFIHRDYHSRNLIITNHKPPFDIGVIDFQDAMYGPITYDLVSLLKDCYIQWPRKQIMDWLTYFYQKLPIKHDNNLAAFTRAFDLCGLQRHLKILGIFCRLYLRDNKPCYLRDLPLTFNYVMNTLESYQELQPLYHFMQQTIYPLFIETVQS